MDVPHDAGSDGFPSDAVEVGRIAGAWGVKGALRVQPHAATPQVLLSCRRWFLRPAEGPGAATVPQLRITSGSGTYSPDGRMNFRLSGVSEAYGPVAVQVTGTTAARRITVCPSCRRYPPHRTNSITGSTAKASCSK